MDSKEITKRIIGSQKAVFETGFNSMVMLQEQTFNAVDNFLRQSPWIPAQTRSIVNDWTGIYKKGTTDFKETADQNYSKWEEGLTSGFEAFKSKLKN